MPTQLTAGASFATRAQAIAWASEMFAEGWTVDSKPRRVTLENGEKAWTCSAFKWRD